MHASLGNYTSDVFKTLSVIGAYEYAGGGQKFCSEHFIRQKVGLALSAIYGLSIIIFNKAMEEIHKLRAQISNIVQVNFPGTDPQFSPLLPPPTKRQVKFICLRKCQFLTSKI
jgi:ATP-dependent RNA helicase DHX37/DHR1